jgi:predicted nucleic acid-binding protein
MNALFDTNIVIDLLAGHPEALSEASRYSEVAISRITWMEVLVGTSDSETQSQWESFLSQFVTIEMDEDICRRAIELRRKNRIKLPDALIRASAKAYGADLDTRNTKDFEQHAPGVRIPYQR